MSIEGKMSTKKTKNKNRRPSININCGQGYKASDVPLNQALYEAGVNISKIMQGKDE